MWQIRFSSIASSSLLATLAADEVAPPEGSGDSERLVGGATGDPGEAAVAGAEVAVAAADGAASRRRSVK